MKLSAYSLVGPYYNVINGRTGEIIKGIQYVDTELGILKVLKPNSDSSNPDEYETDKDGKYVSMEVYNPNIKMVRNTCWLIMGILIIWTLIKRIWRR